jgi:tetratricopeptide (TPR) repeat protein
VGPKIISKYEVIADAYAQVGEYDRAVEYYLKAYQFSGDSEYCIHLSSAYTQLRLYESALEWNLAVSDSMVNDSLLTSRAYLYKQNGRYEDAKECFEYVSDIVLDTLFVASCDSALRWIKNPPDVSVSNMTTLNTSYSEIAAIEYAQGLVFSSSRKNATGKNINPETGEPFFDLYKVKKHGESWGHVIPFSKNINSIRHEAAACFNTAENQIYFTRSGDRRYVKDRSKNVYHLKLYTTKKTKYGWARSAAFFLNDSIYSFAHPTLSQDGNVFMFSSDIPGGFGGADLYVSFRVGEKWTKPKNLGSSINTAGDEIYPYLSPGGALFFASDGHLGMGGYDVYRTRLENGGWAIPENLKYPVNSPQDDFALTEGHDSAYITSNRSGGVGKEDLYIITGLIIE